MGGKGMGGQGMGGRGMGGREGDGMEGDGREGDGREGDGREDTLSMVRCCPCQVMFQLSVCCEVGPVCCLSLLRQLRRSRVLSVEADVAQPPRVPHVLGPTTRSAFHHRLRAGAVAVGWATGGWVVFLLVFPPWSQEQK